MKKSLVLTTILRFVEKYWWLVVLTSAILSYFIIMLLARGQSIWFDEGYSITLAKAPVRDLLALTAVDAHPPFYYLLLKSWAGVFGWSEYALRSLSAIMSAATVATVLILLKTLFSKKVMIISVPFIILAPFFLRYGYEIRMYALVGLIGAIATLVLVKAVESPSKYWWVIYAGFVALGMYTLYMSVVIWLAHLVWLIMRKKVSMNELFKQPWVFAYIGAVILFIPYIPTLIHQLTHSALPGIGSVLNIDGLGGVLSLMFSYLPSWQTGGVLSLVLLTVTGLGIYLVLVIIRSLAKKTRQFFFLLLLCFFVPLIFYILISLLPKPFFIPRYLAHVAIFFYALVGVITALGWKFAKHIPVIIFGGLSLVLLIFGVYQLYQTGNFNFERLQSPRTSSLRQAIDCNDSSVIVADDPYTYIDSVYYFDGCNLLFYSKNEVGFSGGYAPLHDSNRRVADDTSINAPVLYHLHWVGGNQSFMPSSKYLLVSSTTIDKQVVDRYERLP